MPISFLQRRHSILPCLTLFSLLGSPPALAQDELEGSLPNRSDRESANASSELSEPQQTENQASRPLTNLPGASQYPGSAEEPPLSQRRVQGNDVMISWSAANDTLQGFSFDTGEWSTLKIPKQKTITPILGGAVAAVRLSQGVAAYSSKTGTWDILKVTAAPPVQVQVGQKLVEAATADHLYTFAATKGLWTSPTDPGFKAQMQVFKLRRAGVDGVVTSIRELMPNNRVKVTATPERQLITVAASQGELDQIEDLILKLDVPAPIATRPESRAAGMTLFTTPGPVSSKGSAARARQVYLNAEQQSLDLAAAIRKGGKADPARQEELRAKVEAVFNARQQIQEEELEPLKAKLRQIENTLEARRKNRKRIIERRVEELINPDINWSSVSGRRPAGIAVFPSPVATTLAGGRSTQRKVSSANSSVSGLPQPVATTRIGVPIPPQITNGAVAGPPKPALTSSEILAGLEKKRAELLQIQAQVEKAKSVIAELEKLIKDPKLEPTDLVLIQPNLDSSKAIVDSAKTKIPRQLGAWKHEWNQYQSVLQSMRLSLKAAEIKLQQQEATLDLVAAQAAKGFVAQPKLQTAKSAAELARIEVERAAAELQLFESIQKNQKHLNPEGFKPLNPDTTNEY